LIINFFDKEYDFSVPVYLLISVYGGVVLGLILRAVQKADNNKA
jgi:hypothetical protein